MEEFAYTERHMGTDVTIACVTSDSASAQSIARQTFATVAAYEQRFSRFLPESELSELNQLGHRTVSDTFLDVLLAGVALSELTKGAFNPLVQVARLGYRASFDELSDEVSLDDSTYNTNLHELTIDIATNNISLAAGQQLDFGGFLKGYLAQLLADRIKETYSDCAGVIVNLGGDIATRGHDAFHEPFIFLIYNPVTHEEVPVALTNTSLATSGTYQRVWKTDQGPHNHIVDSISQGNPHTGLVAASVVHEDGAIAESLTKLYLTRGVDEALSITSNEPHQYLVVKDDGEIVSNIV